MKHHKYVIIMSTTPEPSRKPMKTLSVPLPVEIYDEIVAIAKKRDQPVARAVRRLIEAGLAAQVIPNKPSEGNSP